jgi:hypothetical protein
VPRRGAKPVQGVTGPRALTAAELSPKGVDWLLGGEPALTIGSYWQYATTLWGYINRSQPFDEPGSLTAEQVYAVTAYLLYVNGIVGEQDVIDARTLPQVKMPNRSGFVPDAPEGKPPRPETPQVGPRATIGRSPRTTAQQLTHGIIGPHEITTPTCPRSA